MRAPEVPPFYAGDLATARCELARAFAERDFVRDLLEPEVTLTVSKNTGHHRAQRSLGTFERRARPGLLRYGGDG